jgi:hypothetical protein
MECCGGVPAGAGDAQFDSSGCGNTKGPRPQGVDAGRSFGLCREITEVLAAHVAALVKDDPAVFADRHELHPPDPRSPGIARVPEELLDGASATQSGNDEGLTQVAHPRG